MIEQAINKDQKGANGIIGCSTNVGCIQRWVLCIYIITWNSNFKQQIGIYKQERQPKDVLKSRKDIDEAFVQSCIDTKKSMEQSFLKS